MERAALRNADYSKVIGQLSAFMLLPYFDKFAATIFYAMHNLLQGNNKTYLKKCLCQGIYRKDFGPTLGTIIEEDEEDRNSDYPEDDGQPTNEDETQSQADALAVICQEITYRASQQATSSPHVGVIAPNIGTQRER